MEFGRRVEITGHAGSVYTIDADLDFIYSGGADKIVARWSIIDGTQDPFAIQFDYSIYSIVRFNNYLAVGLSNGDLHIFDIADRIELKFFKQHKSGIFSLRFDSFSNLLVSGDGDGNICFWDVKSWKLLITLPLNCGKIRDVSFDQKKIYVAGQDGNLRIFDKLTFNQLGIKFMHRDGINCLLIDLDFIYTAGKDAYIRKWNLNSLKLSLEIPAHNYGVYGIEALNPDRMISVSRDKTIKIWDLNLNLIQRLDIKSGGHRHSVNDMKILDTSSFATCSDDGRIMIWTRAKEDKR